jgi:hypothetical protein
MPIIIVLIKGTAVVKTILKFIYLFEIITTATTEREINADAIATPLNPYITIKIGVKTQVAIVQKIMRYKETFIFPMAFRAFVSGVEIDDKPAFIEKRKRENKAGSHFWYFGIKCIKYGDIIISPTTAGKIM